MAFRPRDMPRVNRIFAEVLSPKDASPARAVQAKFYLSPETYQALRKRAAERGVRQSALVEEALQTALSRP